MGQLGVLEGDAQPRLTEGDTHEEVQQQAGETGDGGDPHREDGQQGDGGAHQQKGVELVDIEGHGHLARRWLGWLGSRSYRRTASAPSAVRRSDTARLPALR